MINYELNGKPKESVVLTVEQLVNAHVGNDTGVAVAVNGGVVPRSAWNRTLTTGDTVDILTAIQGG